MRTAAQRIAKYSARMLNTLLDPTLAAVNAQAIVNYNSYVEEFYPLQVHMRQILETYSMPTPMIAGFEAFFGEAYHLKRNLSGALLEAALTVLVAKWGDTAHLGTSNAAVLKAIILGVFQITIT